MHRFDAVGVSIMWRLTPGRCKKLQTGADRLQRMVNGMGVAAPTELWRQLAAVLHVPIPVSSPIGTHLSWTMEAARG